jgi:surface antigen
MGIEMTNFRYILLLIASLWISRAPVDPDPPLDAIIDQHNGINIYYNGKNYGRVSGRNITPDGYNLGLKYQCVEFVKRYYHEIYGHKMPNSYGNAKDYFDANLEDVAFNTTRGLWQYRNIRESKPKEGDILVYGPNKFNRFGHVAIIASVTDDEIEIVQQNMGLRSRQKIKLVHFQQYWTVADYNVLGWLRKEK